MDAEEGYFEHWILSLLARALVDDVDGPHIVVARDLDDGSLYFTGPYPSGVEALVAAELQVRRDDLAGERLRLHLSVAPLAAP